MSNKISIEELKKVRGIGEKTIQRVRQEMIDNGQIKKKNISDVGFPQKKYKTIYADPPWPEKGGGKIKRGADKHYNLMTIKEIEQLPVEKLQHPEGCHLYLWTTNNYLPQALEVMFSWGFEYITTVTWLKEQMGLGQYFRGKTEHCLFGRTDILPYKEKEGRRQQGVTGFKEPKGSHSEKPEKMRSMIEDVSYTPRIELFARENPKGWDCWGNEV